MTSTDTTVKVTFRGMSVAHETIGRSESFLIKPRSTAYRVWETINTISIFVTCILVPFQASFNSQPAGLWVLVYILDAIFLVDVVFHFFLAFYFKGTLITDLRQIRTRYLKTIFLVDVLTLLPLEVFFFALKKSLKWHQAISLLRLNRILRVYRLLRFFGKLESIISCCIASKRHSLFIKKTHLKGTAASKEFEKLC